MKPIFFAAITLLLAGCGTPIYVTTTATTDTQPVETEIPAEGVTETNYQVFYDQLGPYGNWIDYPNYGYVWHPNVDADFRPYATNGHWVYNDEGWVWGSSYNWGWAPFHYGRWFFDDNYGWLWVPGHEWAPSWVTWGRSGDYYGWAPLAPNVDAEHWTPPQRAWNFVPGKRVTRPDVDKYVIDNRTTNITNITQNVTIIKNTTVVNNNYGGNRGNGYSRNGNGNIPVGIDNGRGTSTANPGNYNNRGNNNQPNNGNDYNRGNDNRGNNNNYPNNNGNGNGNGYGRNNNNPPNNPNNNGNGNGYGRNNNNPPNNPNNNGNGNGNGYGRNNNNNPPNNNQSAQGGFNRGDNNNPVNNRPNNPNAPSYSGNVPNNQTRPAGSITVPDQNGYRPVANNNNGQQQQPSKYNRGPGILQVENTTNNRVQPVTIQDKNQPGQTVQNNNRVSMFRPRVTPQQQNQNGQKPAPGKVDSYKQGQKNNNNQ